MILKLNFGEVWLANLNPQNRSEPGKIRPVLIIQNQALLDVGHPSTLIIPITTNLIEDVAPLRLRIKATNDLQEDSDLLIDQIRAIDNKRLLKGPLMKCDQDFMKVVQNSILELIDYQQL